MSHFEKRAQDAGVDFEPFVLIVLPAAIQQTAQQDGAAHREFDVSTVVAPRITSFRSQFRVEEFARIWP